jgi:uncharacterized membrane protein YkvA (DUF1232 family)
MPKRLKSAAQRFRTEIEVYRLVLRHERTPRISRILLGAAVAYAVSPIDLPHFIKSGSRKPRFYARFTQYACHTL